MNTSAVKHLTRRTFVVTLQENAYFTNMLLSSIDNKAANFTNMHAKTSQNQMNQAT